MLTMISIHQLPKTNDGKIDYEKLKLICQLDICDVFYDEWNETISSINGSITDTKRFMETFSKYLRLTKLKEVSPISAPFSANRCPKCNANLGGKKIDECFYENPYYPKCPNCGVPLKRLSWQTDSKEENKNEKEVIV